MTVISLITCRASAVVCLDGSTRKPYLMKRCSLNIESRSSACSSSSNFCLREFLNSNWRIWCFRLCLIRLYLCFLVGSFPFTFPFPSILHYLKFWCSWSWCLALLVRWIYCHFLISCFNPIHYYWIWMVGLPVLGMNSFFADLSLVLVSLSQYVPCGACSAWIVVFQLFQGCWKGSLIIPLPLISLHLH